MLHEISGRMRLADDFGWGSVSRLSDAPSLQHSVRIPPIRPASCWVARPVVALRQPVNPPSLFVSFCYQLPVNHSPAG
jgi:hypothetical protein